MGPTRTDPDIHHRAPSDDVAIGGVDEGAADNRRSEPDELEIVRTPAKVRPHDDDLAVVNMLGMLLRLNIG